MPRDKSRSPVFQLAMTLEMPEATVADVKLAGVEVSMLEMDTGAAKFDLVLVVAPTAMGYEANWQFNTALFDRSTVERIARHFERLLDSALARPATPIALLPMLLDDEKRKLADWSGSASEPRGSEPVHERLL